MKKKVSSKKDPLAKKAPPQPTSKEKKFIETLEGQIMKQIFEDLRKKHFVEAYIFSWATIEQVMIPRLMKFISGRLEIKLSKSVWGLNQYVINQIYYCISHDKDLFDKLERGRKLRNQIIHKMYRQDNLSSIQKRALKGVKYNHRKLIPSILDRFSGKVPIPSLTLYAKGWNDSLDKAIEELEK